MVNFVGEFLVLVGTWKVNIITIFLGSAGLILGAVYGIWLCNRLIFGQIRIYSLQKFADLTKREFAILLPLIVLIFIMGIYPGVFLDTFDISVNKYINYY
jgi:NADH-quinone oxidoreductase subunit M